MVISAKNPISKYSHTRRSPGLALQHAFWGVRWHNAIRSSLMKWALTKISSYASSWFYSSLKNNEKMSIMQLQLFYLESISKLSYLFVDKILTNYVFISRKCNQYIENELLFCFKRSFLCLIFVHLNFIIIVGISDIKLAVLMPISLYLYFTGLEKFWARIKITLSIKGFLHLLSLSPFSWGVWWYRRMHLQSVYLCSVYNFNKVFNIFID